MEIWIKGKLTTACRQRSTRFCADMPQNLGGAHQDETDISTPKLIQHTLVVEDGVSRFNLGQKNKLWRRVLVGVFCGVLIVTINSDLSHLVRGGQSANTVPARNHTTTQ